MDECDLCGAIFCHNLQWSEYYRANLCPKCYLGSGANVLVCYNTRLNVSREIVAKVEERLRAKRK